MTPNAIKFTLLGVAFVIALALGLVGYRAADMDRALKNTAPPSGDSASVTPQAVAPATPDPTAPATSDPAAPPAATTAPSATEAPATAEGRVQAAFDLVRVEPSGEIVVAGRAAPGATVELLSDGRVIATEKANEAGEFVITPPALPPGEHELRLRTGAPGAPLSERRVVVSVPQGGKGEVLVVASEAGKPSEILQQSSSPQLAEAPAAAPPSAPPPSAPPPSASSPAPSAVVASPLRIGAVEVEGGRLFAQGGGPAGAKVRIHLNDAPVAEATVGDDGKWSLTVEKGLTPGGYRVRIDQLDASGAVTARAEAPFDYETPAVTARGPATDGTPPQTPAADGAEPRGEPGLPAAADVATDLPPAGSGGAATSASAPASTANPVVAEVGTVTVRRGDSLWRISRGIYGQGIRYSVIYDANADQIRNPNLIYPDQVFVVPNGSR